jgi:radical SAM superfamily enzyme YgiQ (UPF0313 family)
MKISLITPTPPDISAFGVRSLSAYLKAAGYRTQCLFLPGGIEHLRNQKEYIYQYPRGVIDQIIEICSDSDLIGISFMTQYFDRAVQITQTLKEHTNCPIVWGGVHPTAKPLEGLEYADLVCVGEGEITLLELVKRLEKGEDYTDIPNLWIKTGAKIIQNPTGLIVQELDKLPFMDYDLEGHYIYEPFQEKILPLNSELLKKVLPLSPYFANKMLITYRTLTSRGCPHRCTYCASSAKLNLRRRRVKNVIEELEIITHKYPFIQAISFFDDTFFAAKNGYFKEFSELYKERIGLPFHAQGSPTTINKEKLDYLVQAGLVATEMGIQTASPRIKKIYRREESNESIWRTASLLQNYRDKMLPPRYHIILDNPWETSDDVLETLKLILRLPRPFKLCLSSLIFFPGTELYEKAWAEGLIQDEKKEIYRKPFYYPKGSYLNILIYLAGFRYFPRWLLKLLSQNGLLCLLDRRRFTKFYEKLYEFLEKICLLGRGCKALCRGDFLRILKYLKTIFS